MWWKKKKYEIYLFEGNQIMVDREIPKLQNDGWEIAGNIDTKFSSQSTGMPRMAVPLKRKIKR